MFVSTTCYSKTCFRWPEFKSRFREQYLFVKVPPWNDIDNQQLLTEKLWTKLDHWYYCPIYLISFSLQSLQAYKNSNLSSLQFEYFHHLEYMHLSGETQHIDFDSYWNILVELFWSWCCSDLPPPLASTSSPWVFFLDWCQTHPAFLLWPVLAASQDHHALRDVGKP